MVKSKHQWHCALRHFCLVPENEELAIVDGPAGCCFVLRLRAKPKPGDNKENFNRETSWEKSQSSSYHRGATECW